jgi:hypothetical protein
VAGCIASQSGPTEMQESSVPTTTVMQLPGIVVLSLVIVEALLATRPAWNTLVRVSVDRLKVQDPDPSSDDQRQ